MKKGGITWVHCCRPHSVEVAQYFPPAENSFVRAIPERPVSVAEQKVELEDYVEPESSTAFEEFGEMPEEEIAQKILAKRPKPRSREDDVPAQEPEPAQSEGGMSQWDHVDRDVRAKAMDSLLTSDLPDEYEPPEAPLPGAKGADERASVGYAPPAARMRVSRDEAVHDLDAPPESFGEGEGRLASPAGLPSRSSLNREDSARYMKDAGKKIVYDPLPDLMAALVSPDMLRKSRAIDEIGRLGERGRKAAAALKKLIRDKTPRIRAGAALALGNVTISTDEALDELRRALDDESADVRYSAAMALGRIGTPESRRIFEKHMRRETRRFLRTSAD